jgi:NADPH2:quinone reductase
VDHVTVGREADVVSEVRQLTKGKGVDFAIDGIGGEMLRKTLDCVRRFGTVASIGQAAGPIPSLPVEELGPIRSLSLARPSVMAYAAEQDTYHLAAKAVIEAIRQGTMSEAAQAQSDLEFGKSTGSLVLVP